MDYFMGSDRKGFTLVEIMIVIGIVALLASIAIPQMLRSRMNANEVAAIAAVHAVGSACQSYYADVVPHTYPSALSDLVAPASNPGYLDPSLTAAIDTANTKQGYYFTYIREDEEHFTCVAYPASWARTGGRNFFIDEIGTMTYNSTEDLAPTENDTVVQ